MFNPKFSSLNTELKFKEYLNLFNFLVADNLAYNTDLFMVVDTRNQEKLEPPSYECDDLVERMFGQLALKLKKIKIFKQSLKNL